MALIMNKAFKGKGLIRASILVPWAIPTAVSAKLWAWVFDANGIANSLIGQQILWTTDGWQAKLAVIIADTWKTAPFIGLLTLAGLQVIPAEVYEAAKIDGANAWRSFWTMTLPLVKPALMVAILFRILDNLRMSDLPFVLIGAQKPSVETISMFAFIENGNSHYGPAAAYSFVLFVYVVIVAYLFVKFLGADVIGDKRAESGTGTGRVDVTALPRKRNYGMWAAYAGIALIIIYCLLPFYWMLVSALRRPLDQFSIALVPEPPSFQNFIDAFNPVNNFGIAMVIPLFKLFTNIGWIDTYQAMIIPAMSFALPLAVWNLTAFFRQMPAELEEAAMIDGCTQGQAFRRVIIPIAAPGVFTTAIIVFVAAWNEYIIALTMTTKPQIRTATVAVTLFTGTTGRDIPFGSIMAAGVVLTVPLLIMVLVFQRRIVSGLTAGGVK